MRVRRSCTAQVLIQASPAQVWSVVSDVTRVGQWSGECRGCALENPGSALDVGARFRGRNRRGSLRWTRVNEVTTWDPQTAFSWRTVRRFPYPDSVAWTIQLEPEGSGVRVTESFRVVHLPRLMELALGVVVPAHRDRQDDLVADLGRLKELVEADSRAQPVTG